MTGVIKLTAHARQKIAQRDISVEELRRIIVSPDLTEPDRLDPSLVHYIGRVERKFLRVIGRWEGQQVFLVVGAFFDRRLMRRLR